jgi:DNA-binding XRE family transcriptional regulator
LKNKIKQFREKLGISQAALSKKLDVSQSTVAMWETGENVPKTNTLPELAKALNCSIDDLFEDKED